MEAMAGAIAFVVSGAIAPPGIAWGQRQAGMAGVIPARGLQVKSCG